MSTDKLPAHRIPITDEASWLAKRQNYVNASEVAALFGCHRFMTVADLYAIKRGVMPDKRESVVMDRGKRLETVCAQMVGEKRPHWRITKAKEFFYSDELGMGATPDFYIDRVTEEKAVEHGILETKVVARSAFEREWADGLPPLDVILQVTQQILVKDNTDFGAVGALVIGEYDFECHVYDVPRHPATEEKLIRAVQEFWTAHKAGRMPEFNYEKDKAAIRALFAEPVAEKTVDLSHSNRLFELLSERSQWKAEADVLNARIEAAENEIIATVGDAEIFTCGQWSGSYKLQHRKAYSVAATQYRVLRAKQRT